jgi:inner membrane protein
VTAPNHLAGGYCFTGIISSLLGINILGDYRLLIVIGVASLLPDIDHTKSLIGKIFFPIARFLNRHYGHRTITHSIFVLVGLTATISAFQSVYFTEVPIATVFGLAYGSHILFDCMTIAGEPVLYPFKRNNFVLPGNPEMRLRTSNMRHETMVFCFFIVSAVFMKPLMANGFWTTYNSLFGTFKHLVSEYHKSDDMLHITFAAQRGSEIDTIKGLLVGLEGSTLTLIDKKKRFHTYPETGQIIMEYIPKHTRMRYSFATGDLINITADSLMRFIAAHKCTKLDIQASTKFYVVEKTVEIPKSKLALGCSLNMMYQNLASAQKYYHFE